MKIEIKTEKTIILILSVEEALWLKDYLQNGPLDEDYKNKNTRADFWTILDSEI